MTDFLLELLSEEIPARMQAKARADLERLFAEQVAVAGLKAQSLKTFSTPRRLALIARGLPETTEAVSEELKGPPADAPDAAVEGFLRKAGLTREALETREVKGRATLFAVINKPGCATADVLAEAIPAIIRAFPWPKSMRWGAASETTESLRWVRPLQGIIALLGGEIVPCEIDGLTSGRDTAGHRFHHKGAVTISGVEDYASALRAAHVIVDHEERASIIRDGAARAASDAGFALVEDEGLVVENAGLTEWPVPLLGHFDPAFLEVPPEVIQLTARVNQKYFVVQDSGGALAPAFVCTANIAAHDGGKAIVAGNEKVLAARLSDARFFWQLDQKKTLAQHAEKLSNIVFHEKLGTVADKVERVAKLARWLCEEGVVTAKPLPFRGGVGVGPDGDQSPAPAPTPNPSPEGEGLARAQLATLAEQAARLCKADLVTEMVGEFPELQGLMGGYYAAKEGLDPQVAAAIRDHYKPVGQGDDVPTDPVTVAVSLADKLDTLSSFYIVGEEPTGSKDPFALRRAAIGAIRLIVYNDLRFSLGAILSDNMLTISTPKNRAHAPSVNALKAFIADRLKVQQRDAGIRHDLIDAIFAVNGGQESDLVRLLARVHALQAFVETDEGTNLLAGYKRAANILKKEDASRSPAKAGAHLPAGATSDEQEMDSRLRGRPDEDGGEEALALRQAQGERGPGQPQAERGLRQAQAERELGYTPELAEAALIAALDAAEPRAIAAIEAEDFEGAMAALAALRAPIDAFFESVTVNDADPAKREARLGLLARFRSAVHRVADFSKIEG